MDYKAEMKEIIDKVYTEAFKAGLKEGLKAKFDTSIDKDEEEKDEFKVGDEVKIECGVYGVITRVSITNVGVVDAYGSTYWVGKKYIKRTGRKYPELEKLFQKIRENNT
ncbi:MAG: hypothetical protein LIR46_07730 [Bacteroidota bacterium]|nr:hypothetical protein [Bacteroidota bacterium]